MKTPTPAPEAPAALPPELPQTGGAWERQKDGTLKRVEATDSRPEAIAAALEAAVQDPVKEA